MFVELMRQLDDAQLMQEYGKTYAKTTCDVIIIIINRWFNNIMQYRHHAVLAQLIRDSAQLMHCLVGALVI